MYEPTQVRLAAFYGDEISNIEELEPKIAPDQQTTGFLDEQGGL